MGAKMQKVSVVFLFCFSWYLVGTALSRSVLEVSQRTTPRTSLSSQSLKISFQVQKGLESRGLQPLRSSTYSRVGRHFIRRLLSSRVQSLQFQASPETIQHRHKTTLPAAASNFLDSSSESKLQSAQETDRFQVRAPPGTQLSVTDPGTNQDDVVYDGVDKAARFKMEMIIGVAIALPLFLISLFVGWLCFKFCYLPRSKPPTITRDRRANPSGDSCNTSKSNMSKTLFLGTWFSSCSSFNTSFSSHHSRRRQVVWVSSACEMQYSKLQAATSNFSANNLIGEGGTSRVYRAKLDDDSVAAVKRLDPHVNHRLTSLQFQSEVELMRLVRHPNLVSLLGFCKHGDQRLLVYELMQNGSLEDQLYGPSKGAALTWNLRVKIALESARGLEYLHEHCVPPVVHRDMKASNILLDLNFNAKISDFGLATPLQGLTPEESLQLIGTVGYVAPEFFETGTLTDKSDVYAFGVVLLELLTGRKPIDHSLPPEQHSIVNWTKPLLTDRRKLPHIVAPTLKSHLNLKHLYQVAAVAALCVCEEPSYRPLIADVVQSLLPLVPIELGGALKPSNSHDLTSTATGTEDITPKRVKSRSRSFNRSISLENSVQM